jgi:capsular polysaccharide transport system permease protein
LDTTRAATRATPQGDRRLAGDGLNRLNGWQVQWRVVDALVYRELRTRVSDVRGGFLGVLIQPLGLIAIWTAFLTAINVQRGGSLNTVLFLTSGIVLFTIFSQITNRSINAMDANEALLFYKPVKPIDTVIARTICETGLYTCCLIIVCIGTWITIDQIVLSDIGMFFLTIILAAAIGFSTGLVFMIAGYLSPSFKQVGIWVPRILWFLSGVPFRYWIFPPWTRPFFTWNPLTHIIELNRKSMSDDYFTPDANLNYALICTALMTTFALWIYSNNERKLLTY